MSARAGKRPMRSLTAHEKLEAIRRVHDGESKASVARDIGVPESTLRGWCKNEDKISYLSRQSSPDTDESLESQSKKARLADDSSMQPFNLSLKSNSGTFSPNSETRYGATDCTKNESESSKAPLNLNSKTETSKTTMATTAVVDHLTERERNRAELARMSVELGLNRPEMFLSNLHSSQNFADLSANINLLAHWNTLLIQQQQQQQQKAPHSSKGKVTAPADTSTHAVTSSAGLLTTVDQEKSKHLPKDQQSVNESIWYWLKNQQTKLGLNQNPLTTIPLSNGTASSITTSAAMPAAVNTHAALNGLNGVCPDQSSWFWKWYKQIAYGQQQIHQFPTADKPILYQQLTKETAPAQREVVASDQQNAENLVTKEEKSPASNKAVNNNTKARSVLDNLLFNNNNNVAVNKKDNKAEGETLSQREALEHGEKFLKWLEACSDPSVTAMQIMQFKTLLNNVRSGADRRSGGDQQNKTKVKRK